MVQYNDIDTVSKTQIRDTEPAWRHYPRMAARRTKSLTDVQNANARKAARAIVASSFGGNVNSAAKGMGIAQSGLSTFIAGNSGAGMVVLTALAKHARVSVDDILAGRVQKQSVNTDKFPARSDALHRLQGVILPEVAKAILTREFKGAEALSISDWIADALEEDKRFRRGILPGFAATEDDDRP